MKLIKKYENEAEKFVTVCHKLAKNLYVTSSGGNLAWKLEDNLLLITPTKLYKGDIGLKDLGRNGSNFSASFSVIGSAYGTSGTGPTSMVVSG